MSFDSSPCPHRLANHNGDLAEAVVRGDILPQLVYSLAEQNVSHMTITPGVVSSHMTSHMGLCLV